MKRAAVMGWNLAAWASILPAMLYYARLLYKQFPNSYVWTELLINYQGGFTRRGLLGELAFRLSGVVPASTLLVAVQVGLYLCFVWAMLRWVRRTPDLAGLLFLVSPATLLFPLYDFEAFGRKDVEILAALTAALALARLRLRPALAIGLLTSVYALAALVVESSLFYYPLGFALLMIGWREMPTAKRFALWAVCGLLVLAGFAASFYANTLPFSVTKMIESWRPLYPNVYAAHGAVDFLGLSFHQGIQLGLLHILESRLTVAGYAVAAALAGAPLVLLFAGRRRVPVGPLTILGCAAAVLAMLGTFVMAGDWGRYIHLFTIHAFVLGSLLTVDAECEPTVVPALQTPNERRRRRLIVLGGLLALLLYAGTWRVAHYVPPGVNPLRPGWLLLEQPERRGPGQ